MLLVRSRYALTLSAPNIWIEDACIAIRDQRIQWVGCWQDRPDFSDTPTDNTAISNQSSQSPWTEAATGSKGYLDLGDSLILPAFVNAHTHLEYSNLVGKIPSTQQHFTQWIGQIVQAKRNWSAEDFQASWHAGAQQCLKHGCAWVADHQSVWRKELTSSTDTKADSVPTDFLLPKTIAFPEFIHFNDNSTEVEDWVRRWRQWRLEWQKKSSQAKAGACANLKQIGIAPHAPYTVLSEDFNRLAQLANQFRAPIAIHAAESLDEMDMFLKSSGPMFDMMTSLGRPSLQKQQSPIAFLEESGALVNRPLLAHVNHLEKGDLACLKKSNATIVHTPRCHAYFQRDPFPLFKMESHGIPVCIGTDSLASISCENGKAPELDLKAEARRFLQTFPDRSPLETLARITTLPAKALNLAGQAGSLTPGAEADLTWISLSNSTPIHSALEAAALAIFNEHPMTGIMISGHPFILKK